MGLITNLIRQHNEKQEADLNRDLKLWSTIASMPNATDEMKGIAFNNIGNLAGGALDLPKKSHGVLGQVLAGFSSLNPNPRDKAAGKMQPMPQAGAATQGQKIDGQQMPGAPAYSPFMSDSQVFARDEKNRLTSAGTDIQIDQKKQAAQIELRKQAALVAGLDPSTPAYKDYLVSGKLPTHFGDTTAMKAKAVRIQVGGKWQDALSHPDGSYTTLAGEDIDPDTITSADSKAEPHTAPTRPSYNKTELDSIAASKMPDATQAERDAWVADALLAQKKNLLKTSSVNIAGKEQSMGINAAESGVGPGRGGEGLPAFPTSRPSASTAMPARPPSAAGLPGGAAPPADGAKPPKAVAGQAAADTGGAGAPVTPMRMAYLEQHDQDIGTFMANLSGLPNGGRDKNMNLRAMRGRAKVLNLIPGSTIESLAAEKNERDATKKAISSNIQRMEAYIPLSKQIDNLGQQLQQAVAKFPPSSPKWNEIKQYIAKKYTGDPDTAALVTAANEFQRIYGRFSSGGGQSSAQTNVSAQGKTDEVINSVMKGETIAAVLGQVQKGADNDINGIKSAIKQGQTAIAKPWGTFSVDDLVLPREGPIAGGQGEPEKPKTREQRNSSGAYRYSTDGGATWHKGRLPTK